MDRNFADMSFRAIRKRSLQEMESQLTQVRRTASDLSMVSYMRHLLGPGLKPSGSRISEVDAVYEMSESCRQASGYAAEGVWFPLAALSRDLSSASDSGLTSLVSAGGVRPGSALQAALATQSAVFGGATILTGLTGSDFDLLAIDTDIDASGSWNAEVDSSSEVLPTFRPITMTMKTVRYSLNVSRVLLMNHKLDVEGWLKGSILRRTMAEIDRAAFIGAGGAAPAGLFGNGDLSVLAAGTNGAAPSWDHLVELEYDVSSRAGLLRSPCLITSPKLRKKLRKTPKGTGLDYILAGDGAQAMGYPLRATNHSPDNLDKGTSSGVCSALLFGDLAELIIGFWGPAAVDISVDPVTRADRGEVRLHVRADVAVAPRNIGAFGAYKDLLAA